MASDGAACWPMAVGSFCSATTAQVPGLDSVGLSWPRKVVRIPEPTGGMSGMIWSLEALGFVASVRSPCRKPWPGRSA